MCGKYEFLKRAHNNYVNELQQNCCYLVFNEGEDETKRLGRALTAFHPLSQTPGREEGDIILKPPLERKFPSRLQTIS